MSKQITLSLLICFICVFGQVRPAFAQQINVKEKLEEAHAAYLDAYYENALEILNTLNMENMSDEEQIEAHYLKATILMALGENAKAELNFQQILAINPDWQLTGPASPKVKQFLATERERVHKIMLFSLRDRVAVLQDAGTIFELTTTIKNLEVKLHILIGNNSAILEDLEFSMFPNSNGYIVEVPITYSSTLAKANNLSYYFEVTTKSGALFKVGSNLEPKTISLIIPAAYPAPIATLNGNPDPLQAPVPADNKNDKKRKLAIGIGVGVGSAVVVAAAIVTTVLLVNKNHQEQAGTGSLKITVVTPD